jgi:hypothetical protein
MSQFGMSSRYLHPVSSRLPRGERSAVVAFAVSHRMSVSALIKNALRYYIASQNDVDPGVHQAHSPQLNSAPTLGILPNRQPARPVPPSKSEKRPEQAAMGMDRFDNIR